MFPFDDLLKKFLSKSNADTENLIFQLHHRFTACTIALFCVLVSTKQYMGDPITCYKDGGDSSSDVLNAFCWMNSTFTILSTPNNLSTCWKNSTTHAQKYHTYYHWVNLFLMAQVGFFSTPHILWKLLEKKKLRMLWMGLDVPISTDEALSGQLKKLVLYCAQSKGNLFAYAAGYFFCEVLALIMVLSQICMTDYFLVGTFHSLFPTYLKASENWAVFPHLTCCSFFQISQPHVSENVALCILPVNVLNEKIFVFLRMWFVVLAFLTGSLVIYRMLVITSCKFRIWVFFTLTRKTANIEELKEIIEVCEFGDWFLLRRLAKNMDAVNFKKFVKKLHAKYKKKNLFSSKKLKTTNTFGGTSTRSSCIAILAMWRRALNVQNNFQHKHYDCLI